MYIGLYLFTLYLQQ